MRLAGKMALVTGAGGDIGRSVCQRFLAEGASVAAVDINLPAAQEAIHNAPVDTRVIAIDCDVGDSDAVRRAVGATVAALGGIDVICTIAGGSTRHDGPVTEAPEEEFWRAIRLDLFGTFVTCKHAIPELIRTGGGSVITMSSMVALMGVPGRDCYTAAKGGTLALTRSMAVEYAAAGIRVNAIAPGITRTARVSAILETNSASMALVSRHLLGIAEPLDVAHLAVFLASEESRVVTGQVFPVDSGVTIS
jgi:NAD(P)-dependent dehydrogenase (short-subunit alcohol dehydrogenase family)